MISPIVATVYCGSCIGYGLLINGLFSRLFPKGADELGVEPSLKLAHLFLTGVMLLTGILTVMGLLGLLQFQYLLMVMLGGYLFGAIPFRSQIASIFSNFQFKNSAPNPWVKALILVLVILLVGHGLSAWLLPPKGDAEAFYMAYAKVLAASGVLEPMPGAFNFFSTIGLSGELHFAALMVLTGTGIGAAKLLVWPISIACCVFLAGIVRLCGGGVLAAWLSTAVLLTSSTFTHYISDGKVDLFAAAFGLAAIYWSLIATRDKMHWMPLAWTGWFCGAATVSKFSYLPTLVPAVALLLVWRTLEHINWKNPDHLKRTFAEASLTVLIAVLPWLPQFLKNGVLFGKPLAPFIGATSDSDWLNQVWFSGETTVWILLTYPFALVFGRYPMQGGGLSFLLLAFVPFVFFALRRHDWQKGVLLRVTLAALVAVAIWMIFRPSVIAPRYLLSSLLLFVPFIVIATERIVRADDAGVLLRLGVLGTLAMALLASAWHLRPVTSILANTVRGNFVQCAHASPYCQAVGVVSQKGKQGERVMLAGYYNYWLRADQIQCNVLPAEMTTLFKSKDPQEYFQNAGFKYVVVDRSSHSWVIGKLADIDEKTVLFDGNELVVFELPDVKDAKPQCEQISSGRWRVASTDKAGS